MATEYTSAPPTPVTVNNLQQELVKATQAMRQIPSRANSVSDFSDDEMEEDNNGVATKTTPRSSNLMKQQQLPPTINTHCAGKGIGKRRTSMIQTGIERDLRASSMEMPEMERLVIEGKSIFCLNPLFIKLNFTVQQYLGCSRLNLVHQMNILQWIRAQW